MQVAYEEFWHIPLWAHQIFYLGAAVSIISLVIGIFRQILKWQRCRGSSVWQWSRLFAKFLVYIMGHQKIRRKKPEGIIHFLIFLGFSGLLIATTIAAADIYITHKLLDNWRYLIFAFYADVVGIIFLAGTCMALYRRVRYGSEEDETKLESVRVLSLLIGVGLTGFLAEGLRIAAMGLPWQESWSVMGYLIAVAIRAAHVGPGQLLDAHLVIWGIHVILALGMIAIIPYTKLFHMLASPANILLSPETEQTLAPFPPVRNLENRQDIGAYHPKDLGWRDALEANACTNCRRCEENCPAFLTGKALSPRTILQGLKTAVKSGNNLLEDGNGVIASEAVWSCTACGSCVEHCPVSNSPLNQIINLRIALTSRGFVPALAAKALEGIQSLGNPWEYEPAKRYEWLDKFKLSDVDDEQTEVIYWLGCGVGYDNRIQEIAEATMRILTKAGVKYKTLADSEICCGDPVRRMGEEALFQDLAIQNHQTLAKFSNKTILTHCPHCYHVFKNEYAQLGLEINVVHHSQFIMKLIEDKRLSLKEPWEQSVIYHDPCYLGRHNKEFSNPRQLIESAPNLKLTLMEFEENRDQAFCCGGGGGQLWLESEMGERINYRRFAQAEEKQPDVIATACPYCKIMLDTACSFRGSKIKVKDISELLEIS
ncbi:4Fe-4S dicluster domain-containing protein [Desulfosporosinus fructosivorans]|uniref:4Fe-4S dicluster domain-containing protein n=1 Tax=Desulfosporosinus fructosivorans TaxID=2018669 RepID=A0A4Z0R930_9FIRM|nr:heterodisulfide reductase-related iron-sulfur binding cluster [Desulfosporosinus fructosivorans]TGE39308.1 4Fe-4S dicluster domain-containing protein [Desulfosporosinus fructosivorans]